MTLEEALIAALDDEYHARATYRAVLDAFGQVRPFLNIVESEERHISALKRLFDQYGFSIPVDGWEGRVAAPKSVAAACEAGIEAERKNAALYRKLFEAAEGHPEVEATFHNLASASQENHLPAFERGLRRETRGGGERSGRPRRHHGGRGGGAGGRGRGPTA